MGCTFTNAPTRTLLIVLTAFNLWPSSRGVAQQSLPPAPTPAHEAALGAEPAPARPGADAQKTPVVMSGLRPASATDKYIAPGQSAPDLTVGDKVLLGLKDAGSANAILAAIVAAGLSHAENSMPQYGTNSTAFAQRFGAAVARDASYSILSDSVMASALHEDPRYYRLGPQHKFVKRLAYAITRPLISRTDNGHATPNLSLWSGHLGAAYLTEYYYPKVNRNTSDVLETFGVSFVGTAIDNGVNEFLSNRLNILHNSRKGN